MHEDRDPGAPLGCSRVAAQHVEDDRRGPLGGGGDDVLRDDRVVASGELGRPGGVGGRPEDVAHLRRLRQWVEVCRGGGIPCSARCVPGGFGRGVPGRAVGVGRGGPLEAGTGRSLGEDARGLESGRRARVVGWAFSKITRAGSAHATAYAATARSSSVVNSKSPERVSICWSFAQRAGRSRTTAGDVSGAWVSEPEEPAQQPDGSRPLAGPVALGEVARGPAGVPQRDGEQAEPHQPCRSSARRTPARPCRRPSSSGRGRRCSGAGTRRTRRRGRRRPERAPAGDRITRRRREDSSGVAEQGRHPEGGRPTEQGRHGGGFGRGHFLAGRSAFGKSSPRTTAHGWASSSVMTRTSTPVRPA